MVSFNVTSPVPSIPQSLASDAVSSHLDSQNSEKTEHPNEDISYSESSTASKVGSVDVRYRQADILARYVNDTFTVLKLEKTSKFLNSIFPDIQLTIEAEDNTQTAFLYVLGQQGPADDGIQEDQ
ncbi:unnamed protein product [Schistocephalus solidus]|uniref:Ras-associating domain-containing protein n=1 Tax=Schistocephalus solidus TaxID=70667 RepID=A0A183SJ80_SCHSO|nr:unnamed protein product [Schistocephalus solidus]